MMTFVTDLWTASREWTCIYRHMHTCVCVPCINMILKWRKRRVDMKGYKFSAWSLFLRVTLGQEDVLMGKGTCHQV